MVRKELIEQLENLKNNLAVVEKKEITNSKNGFLGVKTYECKLNNGKIVKRQKLLKNGIDGNAVSILPLTEDEETILVIQPRVFTKNKVSIELPAGYIDDNETPEEAALRELKEETGYVSKNLIKLAEYYQDQGCSAAYNYSYLALNCKKMYEQKLDKDEYIEYLKCSFDDLVDLLNDGYINDANSIIAITTAKKILKR